MKFAININLSTITKNDKRFNATDDRINII
ncbi:hypothetical protein [Staphylococcus aureus]|nr:hypothetical protein [Staphylococcus aureus]MBZ5329986.1 hypothetical protein [Staphylococcus aureus]